MNIAHIVYAKCWGGGEQYVYNFCKEEKRLGYKNIVILDDKSPNIIERFKEVALVKALHLRGVGRFFAWRKYLAIIDKYNIDILNCHSGTMTGFCVILKILRPKLKLIVYKHNLKVGKKDLYHRWLNNKTDALICGSKLVYDFQITNISAETVKKYHLIYNGIDSSSLKKRENYFPAKPIKIGYAGRMVENKGVLTLLEAVKILRNEYNFPCEVYLAGEGNDKTFLEKCNNFIEINGLKNIYHYQKFVKEMSQFYEGIDILVLPSIVKEAFGLVLCEAMYSGVPVISTDSGAQAEIIDNGINGFIVSPQDAASIAKQIMALGNDSEIYKAFSQAGYQKVKEHFTVEEMISKINALFKDLLKNKEVSK